MNREEACEAAFRWHNTWGLTQEDLLGCVFKRVDGQNENGQDIVFVTTLGSQMTRDMAHGWLKHWGAFQTGFYAAWKLLNEEVK